MNISKWKRGFSVLSDFCIIEPKAKKLRKRLRLFKNTSFFSGRSLLLFVLVAVKPSYSNGYSEFGKN